MSFHIDNFSAYFSRTLFTIYFQLIVILLGDYTLYHGLSGKFHSDIHRSTGLINILYYYRTLHRSREPLDIGEEYWAMRDSVVQTELLIMRMLQFQVNFNHPHKVRIPPKLFQWHFLFNTFNYTDHSSETMRNRRNFSLSYSLWSTCIFIFQMSLSSILVITW